MKKTILLKRDITIKKIGIKKTEDKFFKIKVEWNASVRKRIPQAKNARE